jgi:hypothetical protein
MPDVGLTTAGEPVPPDEKVVIKYTVEVGGLAVYAESCDVDKLAAELEADPERTRALWTRRLEAPVRARGARRFSAVLTAGMHDPA